MSLVTVIIATYNRADTIGRAIKSVLEQSYEPIELIVVDDGSTDRTAEIVASFGEKVRYIRQENRGPSAARNTGLRYSNGDIICFLDSDDLWHRAMVAREVAMLEKLGEDVPCCICNAEFVGEAGGGSSSFDTAWLRPYHSQGLWLNVSEVLASRFVLFNQTAAIRMNALKKAGGFDESLRVMEDYDLALRISLMGHWGYISDVLVTKYVDSKSSLTKEAQEQQVKLYNSICGIYKKTLLENVIVSEKTCGCLKSSLRSFERLGYAARLKAKRGYLGAVSGTVISYTQRKCNGVKRRMPSFAKMEVVPF